MEKKKIDVSCFTEKFILTLCAHHTTHHITRVLFIYWTLFGFQNICDVIKSRGYLHVLCWDLEWAQRNLCFHAVLANKTRNRLEIPLLKRIAPQESVMYFVWKDFQCMQIKFCFVFLYSKVARPSVVQLYRFYRQLSRVVGTCEQLIIMSLNLIMLKLHLY